MIAYGGKAGDGATGIAIGYYGGARRPGGAGAGIGRKSVEREEMLIQLKLVVKAFFLIKIMMTIQ